MLIRGFVGSLALMIGGALLQCSCAYAGTGWRALDTPAISVKEPNKVVLISIANAGARLVAVGEHGVITYSDDNGVTWRQAEVPVDVTLTAVGFANSSDGWAVGHYGVILHTVNGGITWKRQLDGLQANQLTLAAARAAVADNNQSPGAPLALKRANIFVSNGPDKPFLSLLVSNPNNVIVFGAYRMTMKTTDGGKTWVDWSLHIGDPLSHNLYDDIALSSGIYVVGEMGVVFRSTDSGNSFPMVSSPTDATLFSVLPTGDKGIFVCGVAGRAYWSGDNGETWQPSDINAQSNLTSGILLKSGTILVASEDGTLYESFDHTRKFTRLPEVQPMAVYDLAEAKNGAVAVVGSSGVRMLPAADFLPTLAGD